MHYNDGKIKAACSRWIAVCVDMLDHEALQGGPFDRRSAWLWMIANAAPKDKKANHKGKLIELKRGELLIGRSFLAGKWGWGEQSVRTFLNLLVAEGMIEINQSNGHYASVATICNYSIYQTPKEKKNQSANQSLTSVQPEPNQTLTEVQKDIKKEDGEARERECDLKPESEADRLNREAYERGLQIKGGSTAKSARATLRSVGELDGSTGITLAGGKLTIVNGSAALLASEFPGIDLAAVCNRAAPGVMKLSYPTHDAAMAEMRKWAQIVIEERQRKHQPAAPAAGKPTLASILAQREQQGALQ